MDETYILKGLKKGLIAWYDFRPGSKILYIGDASDAVAEYLVAKMGEVYDSDGNQIGQNLSVVIAPIERAVSLEFCQKYLGTFDYVISVGTAELVPDLRNTFVAVKTLCSKDAICLFGMNNRMGIKYFCGDRDPYTNRNFDGVEGYKHASDSGSDTFVGRMYSKSEIKEMITDAGVAKSRFYSILSDLDNPIMLFAEGYIPKEDLATRIYPVYNSPETVFLEEENLYKSLVENDMFHQMANAYLVEFTFDEKTELSDALQITSTTIRNPQDAMLTVIYDECVEKINVHPEGRNHLVNMMEYAKDLNAHGIKTIPMELTDRGLKMPFIDAPVGQLCLKNLFLQDKDEYLKAMDRFRDIIMQSSVVVREDMGEGSGALFKYGYPDLIPLNSFYIDGEFVFFDQEFREDNYPANEIVYRLVTTFYMGNLQGEVSKAEMYDRYGLTSRLDNWRKMEGSFLSDLRNDGILKDYYKRVRRNASVVEANRQRMNFAGDDYYRLFIDIFDKLDSRKLVLFGSGKYAARYLDMYESDRPAFAIVDNNQEKWGQELNGVKIYSPEYLKELSHGEYQVLICVKNYIPIMQQLDEMGITEYCIYDPDKKYEKRKHPISEEQSEAGSEPKKYHVGYIAGVFDLFHVGHLNMFKRAKEQCDYLIVGVVTDEGALKHNKKKTFVPFEERIEMVRSCRYVDEAVKIPVDQNDTKDAFAMYHFDVQFSGSDYINNQSWLNKQKFLRENGADLVFFSYTQSTCSTNLKALIEKGLAD